MKKHITEIQLFCNSTTTIQNQFEKWPWYLYVSCIWTHLSLQ